MTVNGGEFVARNVLLVMHRKLLSDALIAQTTHGAPFTIVAEQDYAAAVLTAETCSPDIVLMEIPESGPWGFTEKCLTVCDMIRSQLPGCKQVILCNEFDAESCRAAIRAKQAHRIDDFLFYENSVNYLLSKLEALIEN